jgi:hypothetical protein
MATVFENAKDGYLDKQAGMKSRREIYEPGDSQDVNVSIEKFLGRKQSIQPFLKKNRHRHARKRGIFCGTIGRRALTIQHMNERQNRQPLLCESSICSW